MSFLSVSGVCVAEEGTTILHDISFNQPQYRKLTIAGETGSGKSTLLQTIAGLIQPVAGNIYFNGEKVVGPHDKLVPGHPGIAYLSQQYELPQFLRVEQVLRYSNTLSDEEAVKLYDVCRISHLVKRKTNQLSGGERQRIALARLLSSWPDLLLLDEPFSNLDMGHKKVLKSVIRDISEELGITLVLISHDPLDTLSWADEIMVMQQGRLIQQGTPQQIYKQPVNAYAASLFGKYSLVPATIAKAVFGIENHATQQLLLRPENIKLVHAGGVPGVVTAAHYYGSFYELEVQIGEATLLMKTAQDGFTTGAPVQVEVGEVWWV